MKTFTKFLASLVLAVVMLPAVASAQLNVTQGGTGLTSVSANNVLYGVSSLRLGSEAAFTYNPSTNLLTASYASTTGFSATNGDLSKLTVTYASSTGFTATNATIGTATGTNLYGFGLPGAGCNGVGQALTWASGLFGCGTITAAGDGVSNWNLKGTGYIGPTSTVGISVQASSTIGGGTGATGLTVAGTATSTDLVVRNLTSALTLTDGQGLFAEYAGTTCTNQFVRVLSALGVATCATVDISADTNLTADGTEIVLTGDALSLGTALTFTTGTSSTSFQTALLGVGTDYISDITGTGIINTAGSLQASLGTSITASEMANGDHGFFTYSTNVASVDANAWTSANLASYLSDETGTAGSAVFSVGPSFTGTPTFTNLYVTPTGTTTLGFASTTALTVTNNAYLNTYTASAGTTTNATSTTGWFSSMLRAAASIFTDLTATNAVVTNGTTTNASSTNFYASGSVNLNSATVKQHVFKSFTWPGSPTTTTATNTVPLGSAYTAELWNGAECWVTSGTGSLVFSDDGTNDMNPRTASTTVGRFVLSSNNTFTTGEKRVVEIGALTAAQLSCTVDITVNN